MAENKFKLWPTPAEGMPYGPTGKQKLLFIEELPDEDTLWWDGINIKRPHYHDTDTVLFIGAARCLGFNTFLRMFDNTTKAVQDIDAGDLLMGPDFKPRKVLSISKSADHLYEVSASWGSFICNKGHILNLLLAGVPTNISVEDFLQLPRQEQDLFKLHRALPIDYVLAAGGVENLTGYISGPFSIKYQGEGDCYGLDVSDDQLFLMDDFTILHNSGKTLSSMRRIISYLNKNPGAVAIVGADNYKQLQRTALVEWEDVFSNKSPWDHIQYKNGIITRRPVTNDQRVVYRNGSVAHFLHFKQEEKLKGLKASIIGFEEADMLPHEGAFEELLARLSNPIGEVRQIILTTNPVKARKGWIKQKFKLWQNDPDYKGKIEPIVPPCTCQYCPKCSAKDRGNWKFVDSEGNESTARGSECSNPDCPIWEMTSKSGQPFRFKKDNNCPGDQISFRVIETSSDDNPHKPSTYEQSASAGMSKKTAAAMIGGKITEDREGEVYSALHKGNILFNEVELDYGKDLIWSLDFNYDPQCSVIAQETETEDSMTVNVIDEIMLWDALPEHAAREFCARYHKFKFSGHSVRLYSDPSGLWGVGKELKPTFYKTVLDYLRSPTNELGEIDKENGTPFKVEVMIKLDKRKYRDKNRVKVKILVSEKVDSINAMLMNELGESRLFINYHCQALIMSLEGTKWDNNDGISKNIDIIAARKRESILPMTHPSDALGYYIAKRFPLIKHKRGVSIVHSPGESSFVVTAEGYKTLPVKAKIAEQLTEDEMTARELKKKDKAERKEARRQKRLLNESKRRMASARKIFGGGSGFPYFEPQKFI